MYVTDEQGKWLVNGRFKQLIEPSQAWIDASPVVEPDPPDPTYEDYLLDLDFRLSMIELGL